MRATGNRDGSRGIAEHKRGRAISAEEWVRGGLRASALVDVARAGRPGEVEPSGRVGLRRCARSLRCRAGVEDGGDGVAFTCCFAFDFVADVFRAAPYGWVGFGLVDPGFDGEADFVGDGPVIELGDDVQLGAGGLVESDREGFDRAVAESVGGRSRGGRGVDVGLAHEGGTPP